MHILHGDHQVASREKLLELKRDKSVLEFFGADLTVDKLHTVLNTKSLFGPAHTVVIESLFSQRNSTQKKDLISYLLNHLESDVIIWEPKDVSAQAKDFPEVLKFDLPKYIFSFLDNPTIPGLQQVLQTMPAEQIFASLATRAYKRANTKWLASLLDLDFKLKTGALPYDLATALELWCAKL